MRSIADKKRIYIILGSIIAFVFLLIMAGFAVFVLTLPNYPPKYHDIEDETTAYERRVPTIDEDFEDNIVIVVMKHAYSKVNQPIDKRIFTRFNNVKVKSIEDLTYFSDPSVLSNNVKFTQILSIELQGHDKQKVLDAIVEFEKLYFISAAEPSYNHIAVDC